MRGVICTLAFIFISNFLTAQNLKPDWSKLVDYVNCKYVEVYIESVRKIPAEAKNIEKYEENLQDKLKSSTLFNPLSFDSLSFLLKQNGWSGTEEKLASKINEKKDFPDPEKTIPNLISTSSLSDVFRSILESKRKEIEEELHKHYRVKTQKGAPILVNNEISKENNDNSFFGIVLLVGLLNAITLLVLALFVIKRTSENRIKQITYNSQRLEQKFALKNDFTHSESEKNIIELNKKITELEKTIQSIKINVEENKNRTEKYYENAPASNVLLEKAPWNNENSKLTYLKTAKQGVFSTSFDEPSGCFFKVFEIRATEAKFEFCGNEAEAIANRDAIFDNVCETYGIANSAKKIRNEEFGIVEFQDGKWKVIKKAKIKFE